MAIHHTQVKKAEKIGVILSESSDVLFDAFWPKHNLHIFGVSPTDAIQQASAAQEIMTEGIAQGVTPRIVHHPDVLRLVNVSDGDKWLSTEYRTPGDLRNILRANNGGAYQFDFEQPNLGDEMVKEDETDAAEVDNTARSESGVALDGRIAYAEGTSAGDCPYSSETEDEEEYSNFERWNEEWDAAADEQTDEDAKGGSVVKEKYRAIYAERGHPTHCGDWLAELLNNLVLGKKATDIARFEGICNANGVSLAKYKHEGKGWEGRLRMTGRNLLAKVVFHTGGVLKVPSLDPATPGDEEYRAPGEWMDSQRFKKAKTDAS